MGVYLAGSYRSQRRSGVRRAMANSLRRLCRRDGGASARATVELSDHAQVLSALRGLHVAAGSTYREAVPVPRGFLQPAADSFDRGAGSCSDAGANRVPVDVHSEAKA